jgi:hypothetical protein
MAFAAWLGTAPNHTLITREAATGGAQARLTFAAVPGVTYQVQFANSLTTPIAWQQLGTATANNQGQFEIIDPAPLPPQRFYRAVYP